MKEQGLFDDGGRVNPVARNDYVKPHLNFRPAGQPTSKVAGVKYEKTGKSKTQRQLVHEYIIAHPGRTGAEIEERIHEYNGASSKTAHQRLSELARVGVIESSKPRTCNVTGQTVLTWFAI